MNAPPRRLPRWCRALLALLLGCVVAGVSTELLVRWMLFGSGDLSRRLGKPFRVPSFWVPDSSTEDRYKLQTLFDADRSREVHGQHPLLGWIADVDPNTWAHRDEGTLLGRRPVLLFGDSFAQCTTAYADCWQGLLARSELAESHALLNYGIGGYGLDQIALLSERVVPRFADRDPVVVVAILVDDDLERCFLRFRGDAKPVFRLVDGELVLDPPGGQHRLEWIADHPPAISSYLSRLLAKAAGGYADEPVAVDPDRMAKRVALLDAILDRIRDDLAARGIREWFVLEFHGQEALAHDPQTQWQEDVVDSYCRRNGIRLVSSRPYLEAAIAAGVPQPALFVDPSTTARGHYSEAGNLVVSQAILQGLRRLSEPDLSGLQALVRSGAIERTAAFVTRFSIQGRPGDVCASAGASCVRVRRSADGTERLSIRAGDLGVTDIRVSLIGKSCFSARIRAVNHPDSASTPGPPMVISWKDPAGTPRSRSFEVGAPEVVFTISDLEGETMQARIERPGGDPRGAWLILEDPRLDCEASR